jgi:hypothetical protein
MTAKTSSMQVGPISLYNVGGHHIWAELKAEGALVISGQDLRSAKGWSEYEYALTILRRTCRSSWQRCTGPKTTRSSAFWPPPAVNR